MATQIPSSRAFNQASDQRPEHGEERSGRWTWCDLRHLRHDWRGNDGWDGLVALIVLGCLIEVFFIILTYRFWLTRFFPDAGIPYGKVSVGFPQMMSGNWSADAKWYSIVCAAPFVAYVPAIWYISPLRSRLAAAIVGAFVVLFGITLVGVYPIAASDLFHYMADARTFWVYHQNPLLVPPQAHPFVIGISFAERPSPYGPFWQILAAIPTALTGDNWVAAVLGFKLLALASYLACAVMVYLTVRRMWPGRELFACLVFAWNPFIVYRAVGNGHNDIAMMALALGAVYCAARRQWLVALPLLALSVCIKYSTALIVPPFLLYAWVVSSSQQRRRLVAGAAAAGLLTVVVFLWFWQGFDTFKAFSYAQGKVITSVPELVSIKLQPGRAPDDADPFVRQAGYVAFFVVYVALLAGIYLRPTYGRLVAACALSFIAYLVLCTWWFRPWYFLWFLALTPLLPSFWWTAIAVATTFGTSFFDMIEQYRSHWDWIWSDTLRGYGAPVISAFLPLLLFILLGLVATKAWSLLPERSGLGKVR